MKKIILKGDGPREMWPVDTTEIVEAMASGGFDVTRQQAEWMWEEYSMTYSAGWLQLSVAEQDGGIVKALRPFFWVEGE